MKITIINGYCYLNKGDAGIIITMVKSFKEKYPDSSISVVSLYPEIDKGKYRDCRILPPIITPYEGKNKYIRVLRNIILYLYTIFLNKMNINHNKSVQAIKEADIVVSCGGGFFQSINIKYFLSNFIYHLIQMKTAIQFNKDLVLYAQSIGAFSKSKFILFHVKEVLNAAKLILVREGLSYKNVEELLDDTEKLHITGDIAFLLEKSKSEKYHILDKNRYHIGITIRNWNFPNKSNVELLKSKYKKSIIDLIEYLTSQRNISVYLLPQVIGPGQDNDRIINKEVYSKLKNIDHVNLIDIDISPQELKDLYSKLDLLIGTRMHSNIFALSSGTPCVAISYEQKTDGIMSDLNLSNYVIKIDKINSTELIEKVNLALADHANIKHHLAINIPKMLDRSAENNRLLFEYLREKGKK